MVRAVTTDAVLLRSVDFGEADRVLTLLTEAAGRVSVMARGARSSRRRFGGALEPFARLAVEFTHGRSGMGRLQQARIVEAHPAILASLLRMQAGGAALDLTRRMVSDDNAPDPELFDAVAALLGLLARAPEPDLPRVSTGFTLRLMSLCGVAVDLGRCGRCGRRARPTQPVTFDPAACHVVCRECGGGRVELSPRSRALAEALYGPGFHEAAALPWPQQQLDELTALGQALVAHHTRR